MSFHYQRDERGVQYNLILNAEFNNIMNIDNYKLNEIAPFIPVTSISVNGDDLSEFGGDDTSERIPFYHNIKNRMKIVHALGGEAKVELIPTIQMLFYKTLESGDKIQILPPIEMNPPQRELFEQHEYPFLQGLDATGRPFLGYIVMDRETGEICTGIMGSKRRETARPFFTGWYGKGVLKFDIYDDLTQSTDQLAQMVLGNHPQYVIWNPKGKSPRPKVVEALRNDS